MARPPPPMNRPPPPQGPYSNAPRSRGPPPPQPVYDQGYQQDWNQGGYDQYGYQNGYQNGYDDYGQDPYAGDQSYAQGGYGQNGYYDAGYDGYDGYQQPPPPKQRPPPDWDRRRGPPPPGMRGGQSRGPPQGQRPSQRGPPRDPYAQGPPPQDPRARSKSRTRQRDDRYYGRGPPGQQQGWDDQYGAPLNPGPRQPQPGARRPRPPPTEGMNYPLQYGNGSAEYADDQGYEAQNGYAPGGDEYNYPQQQEQPPPPHASHGSRNRAPLPDFRSVKQRPPEQRLGTSHGARSPPSRPIVPPQSQTAPATPVDGAFHGDMYQSQQPQGWPMPQASSPPQHPHQPLTIRNGPGPTARPESEMPNFGSDGQANGQSGNSYRRPEYQPTSLDNQQPSQIQQTNSQDVPPEERFEMPGSTPGISHTSPSHQDPGQQPFRPPARSQTSGPHTRPPPEQHRQPPPTRRQMTTDGIYQHDPRGPPQGAPRGGLPSNQRPPPQDGWGSEGQALPHRGPPPPIGQESSFSEPAGASRPRTPGGSRPNTSGVERPNFYPAMDTYGGSSRKGSEQGASRRGPEANRQPKSGATNGAPAAQQPNGQRQPLPREGSQHKRLNSDALPAHPAPVRPGLGTSTSATSGEERPKPAPVRQYNTSNRDIVSATQAPVNQPPPVTQDELNSLRNDIVRLPSDYKTHLVLAKKLIEASQMLSNEGGRADQKTRQTNQKAYIEEAYKLVRKLVSHNYPDAMFFLADCFGAGSLGLATDPKEAFTLYQSAGKLGHAQASYRTAVCCEIGSEEGGGTRRDYQKAVQWYKRAASLGDIPSMYKMGIILLKGLLNQEKNLGEAVGFLKQAADRADEENPHALHELALIYESPNNSMKRDEAEAFRLFTQAGKLGYKFSQFKLGQCYEYGHLGATVDPRTSIIWHTKAASQGEHQSELALSGWYLTGAEGILEHSDTEAYLWARKAASADPPLPKAMFAMGYFTEVGIGCPRNMDEAKRWYGRAATHNFPKARERLEEIKRGGSQRPAKEREKLTRHDQKKNDENCTIM